VIGALARYGDGLGIAFQMADDLLDWGGDVGADRQEHGRRFPRAETDAARDPRRGAADAAERAFWVRTIEKGDQGDGDLDHAMEILRRHGTLDDRPAGTATRRTPPDAATPWPMCRQHALTEMMADLADYVVARLT
jgi:octaprenyl-diphosphate synthase